ncbi:putative Ig domain-containing protein [Fuerstiella marisgermanici]|uniref:Cell wall-associated polypeptide n=1 Tax=Fuerstiella marisgermanici TaxID=1891926 RepID=A0A1P8WH74_9PLAN|nr:putative Ig domain-containing protein [Fuerstiella marisgermanici]APZ93419.1 Cell wall-associated polypeptide [Fuerstiella marisgermanici]
MKKSRRSARHRALPVAAFEVLEERVLLAGETELKSNDVVRVNDHDSSWQGSHHNANQAIGGFINGGFVSVWQSYKQDRSGWGIYGQRFDENSGPVGAEFQVAQTTKYSQLAPTLDVADDGSFAIAWQSNHQDGSSAGIYVRRYSAAGQAVTGEIQVNETTRGNQSNPDVAILTDGNFAVVWNGRGSGDRWGSFVRVFEADGHPTGGEQLLNASTNGIQGDPAIAASPDGGFWTTWAGSGADDPAGIYASRFDADGIAVAEPSLINSHTKRRQTRPTIDVRTDGTVLIGWQSWRQDGSSWGTYGRLLDADGGSSGSVFRLNELTKGIQHRPDVAFLSDDSFVATWTGRGAGDRYGVFVRQFDLSGNAISETARLSDERRGWQARSAVAATTLGFVSMWSGRGPGDRRGVFARQFETNSPTALDLSPIEDRQIQEGQELSITPVLGATSGEATSFEFVGGVPTGATIDSASGLIVWTPTEEQGPAEFEFTIRATGPDGIDNESFKVSVAEENVAPVLAGISDKAVNEGEELFFVVSASDIDIPANTLSYRLADNSPDGASIDPLSGAFLWTPNEIQGPGNYEIGVIANDGTADSDLETFTVIVGESNEAPVLAGISDKSVIKGEELSFLAIASDIDVPTNTLNYRLTDNAPDGASIDPVTGEFLWTPSEIQGSGNYEVGIIANDGTIDSDSETFTVIVGESNVAPVLAGISDKSVIEGEELSFVATASDIDIPANTLNYRLTNNPPVGASIDPVSGEFSWTPSESQGPGNYEIGVIANDGAADSDSETFTVIVGESNEAPVLAGISDESVIEGEELSFRAIASDVDVPANSLSYRLADNSPAGATIDSASGLFSWVPTEEQGPGDYVITIIVEDGAGGTDSETMSVTVEEVNSAPILGSIGDQAVLENEELTFTVSAMESDIPENTLVYSLGTDTPAGAMIDPTTGVFSWTPTEAQGPGSYSITIAVEDGIGGADSETISVNVGEENSPPLLASIGDRSIEVSQRLAFTASATDGDSPDNSLTFSLDSGAPDGAEIDAVTGEFSWVPASGLAGTIQPVTVRVTDNGSPTHDDFETFNITVTGDCSFNDELTGWTVTESGGGTDTTGGVESNEDCAAVITEGDSFVVTLEREFVVPADFNTLSFTYENLNFDTTDTAFVNDAFEVALVDSDGNSLVSPFTSGRDAFLNVTEDAGVVIGADVSVTGTTVTVDVSDVLAGEIATLIFRLANNDSDALTTVTVINVEGIGEPLNSEQNSTGGTFTAATRTRVTAQSAGGELPGMGDRQILSAQTTVNAGGGSTTGSKVVLAAAVGGSRFIAGDEVLITGSAVLSSTDGNTLGTIETVFVNGNPVEVLDEVGRFFSRAPISIGDNRIRVEAHDSTGGIAAVDLMLVGTIVDSEPDFSRFSDITGSFSGLYGRTSFSEDSDTLHVELATRNDGAFEANVPLLVGVQRLSDPAVGVMNADGVLPDGTPYWDFTDNVTDGRLGPGELSTSPTISFHNPRRTQFDYDLVFFGKLNAAPLISTVPEIEAHSGREYLYNVDATDTDGDLLNYSLTASPVGMLIDPASGEISWTPSPTSFGRHDVSVEVDDGLGGVATQTFTVAVSEPPANRPPVIETTPLTRTNVVEPQVAQSQPLDLNLWDEYQYDFGGSVDVWSIEDNGTTVRQLRNSDPTMLLSDAQFDGHKIEGSFRTNGNSFRDVGNFKGFVFGYQDPEHYYLFDWKRRNSSSDVGIAEPGMSIKRIDADSPLDEADLWPTAGNGDRVNTLFHNSIPWRVETDYGFSITIDSGKYSIVITEGESVLETIEFEDTNGYAEGRFGFYNYRQGNTVFSDFSQSSVANGYLYDVKAVDADGDALTFSLSDSPPSTTIDPITGRIRWRPTSEDIGNHQITVSVSDGNGGVAVQTFVLCVHPIQSNHAPRIVSTPITRFAAGVGSSNPSLGDTSPERITLVEGTSDFAGNVSLTLPENGAGDGFGPLDIVFVVDESGSMAPEQQWLGETITELAESLEKTGLRNNRYGLVGFTGAARTYQVGDDEWMSATELSQAIGFLRTDLGGSEDGYLAINHTLDTFAFRPSATRAIILVTDEDRATVDESISFASISNRLDDEDVFLGLLANAAFEDADGIRAAAVEDDGTAHVSDNQVTARVSTGGTYTGSAFTFGASTSDIFEDYVELAWGVGGVVWDLNLIGGTSEQVFTDVFVDLVPDQLVRKLAIDLVASLDGINFVNRSGIIADIGPGETASFDVEFDKEFTGHFDLAFVNANSNQLLGSIPVVVGRKNQYQLQAVDPDNDPLTFELISGPAGMSVDSSTGLLGWIAPAGTVREQVVVQVSDGRGGVDQQTFWVEEDAVGNGEIQGTVFNDTNGNGQLDQEPRLADAIVYLDENRNGFFDRGERFTTTDVDGNYSFDELSNGEFDVRAQRMTGWQVSPNSVSSHTVTIDGGNRLSSVNFGLLTVASIGNSPQFTSTAPVIATTGHLYRYEATASDADSVSLTFSLESAPEGMTVHPELGTVVWLPSIDQVGTTSFVLSVSDETGGRDTQAFNVTVSLPNGAPLITSEPVTDVFAGQQYVYPLAALDPENQPVEFQLLSGPDGMSISSTNVLGLGGEFISTQYSLEWTIPQSASGTDPTIELMAFDAEGGESQQTFHLSVAESRPNIHPEIVSNPGEIARFGLEWRYQVAAIDSNGDELSYELTESPQGMLIDDHGLISWVPIDDDPGPYPVSVSVIDGPGLQRSQEFSVEVVSSTFNSAPAITSNPRLSTVEGEIYAYDASAFDAQFDPLLWRLEAAPRGMAIDAVSGMIRWQPDGQQFGTHFVTVSVIDAFQARAVQRFEVEVGCHNLAPAIISIPPTAATTGLQYVYPIRAIDLEGDDLAWQLTEFPNGMLIDESTGVIQWSPDTVGTHDILIEVSDGRNTATQAYSVVVADGDDFVDPNDPTRGTKSNRAPVITSTPGFGADVGTLYQYQVIAIDPEGNALTYSLGENAPAGMQISPTGVVTWTPAAPDLGQPTIAVIATDDEGATATQAFTLDVAINESPTITSEPKLQLTRGGFYRYSVRATDPDGDPLTYSLDDAPEGMTIDQYGRIIWQSTTSDAVTESVFVSVSDDHGQTATQAWEIQLLADDIAPSVAIEIITDNGTYLGEARVNQGAIYHIRVAASDNVAIASMTLFVDDEPVALDATGRASFMAENLGRAELTAEAVDSAGLRSQSTGTVFIVDPAVPNQPIPTDPTLPPNPGFAPDDNGEPIVNISSPTPGTPVSGLVPIIGTVDDPEDNLWYYRAYYGQEDLVSLTDIDLSDPDWTIFEERTTEVIDGELAVFDPSVVPNDAYTIAVAGFDVNGLGYVHTTQVYVEGNVQLGNFRLDFTDLSIPLAGIPIEVTRVYDTANADFEGDFGFGWQLGVQDARILEATAIGEGGALNYGQDKFHPDVTKVYLTNPDGNRVGFTYREELISASFFGAIWRPYFDPDPGVYDTLAIDETQVARGGLVGALSQGINPEFYTLTTKEGLEYRYSDTEGLQTITDLNGNVVTFSEDGIAHSSGESIQFIRDNRGRIEQVIDPAGQTIEYGFDLAGDLVSVTNQADLTTRYTYRSDTPHFLDEAFDSLDVRTLKAQYEPDPKTGILVFKGVLDAFGNRVDNRDFDLERRTGVIRDGNGNETNLTFNDRGNVLTETDPLGSVREYRYEDSRNPDLETKIIDKDGHVTDLVYDGRGNLLRNIELGPLDDPFDQPIVTIYTYDEGNRVRTITDARNHTTTFRYFANGNLREIVNAADDSAFFTYHDDGNVATFTDFKGHVTRFDEYLSGQPGLVTYEDGVTERREYNQYGQVTLEQFIEPDGRVSQQRKLRYDELGRLVEEVLGEEGNAVESTTRRLFYDGDVLDWEIVVHPSSIANDGTLIESPETPIGERQSSITDYVYDAKQQLIQQIDAEGGVIDFRYDAHGNRIALRDPVGNLTTWLYDGLHQPVEERDPLYWDDVRQSDEFFSNMTDDDFLNLVAPLDPSEVTDPLYDEPSGANAEENRGAEHVIVSVFDTVGNLDKKIDRNGRVIEYVYDFMQNLTEERWYSKEGDLVRTLAFTFDPVGNMLTANDPDSSLTFTYDELNRQRTADNAGTPSVPRVLLTYGYDENGNVTSVVDSDGVSVVSRYNSRNLLEHRAWFDSTADLEADVESLSFEFSHDAAERVTRTLRYAATAIVGTVTREYDLVGRSELIRFNRTSGSVLSEYEFGYDELGRMGFDSRAGVSSTYTFDLTGQLTSATRSDDNDEFFTYDANGNRTLDGYETGVGNRLVTDGNSVFEYDGEGNRITRTVIDTNHVTRYEYDHRKRLVRITGHEIGDDEVEVGEYIYDTLGRRIVVTTVEGATVSVYERTHVWVDFDSQIAAPTRFVHGDQVDSLLALSTGGDVTFFANGDHLGSVVGYVDLNGELQSSVSYQSFGGITTGNLYGRIGFTGQPTDSFANLIHYRSRFLDRSTGTFISEDSRRFVDGANLFMYALNNPNQFRDPFGTVAAAQYASLAFGVGTSAAFDGPSGNIVGGIAAGFGGTLLFSLDFALERAANDPASIGPNFAQRAILYGAKATLEKIGAISNQVPSAIGSIAIRVGVRFALKIFFGR